MGCSKPTWDFAGTHLLLFFLFFFYVPDERPQFYFEIFLLGGFVPLTKLGHLLQQSVHGCLPPCWVHFSPRTSALQGTGRW